MRALKLIYYADVEPGGLSGYATYQAAALSHHCSLIVLGLPHLRDPIKSENPEIEFVEMVDFPRAATRWRRGAQLITRRRAQIQQLCQLTRARDCQHVLLSSFAEYMSPFWVSPLQGLHNSGVRIGVVVHDPVRDFRIGPRWWHELSISMAYRAMDAAFVHDGTKPDTGWPSRDVPVNIIPLGPYTVPSSDEPPAESRNRVRAKLGIPPHSYLMFSFGHVRDGKNLNLVIEALADHIDVHLLVVGREQSASQRTIGDYQSLAKGLGVGSRCHWLNQFVPVEEIAQYFEASDCAVITYSADFHSASAVLANISQFRIPVLASSGGGPLKRQVEEYGLGIWVKPDQKSDISQGIAELRAGSQRAAWDEFIEAYSWSENARRIVTFPPFVGESIR